MELFSEYFNKEHFLARVDARIKIFVSLAVMIMVLSYRGFMLPLFVLSLCLLLSIWMKIPVKTLMLRFSEPLFIAFIIMIVKLFSGKVILFSINIMDVNISGYKDGFIDGLIIALRILGAVSVLSVTGFSTPFTEFIAGLSWLRVPKGIIEILMFAYRYIFVLLEDAMVIYNAQKNRLGYTNIRRGLSSFGMLSGSLIIKAFEQSNNITLAMVQRGYDGEMPMFRNKPFKPSEVICSVLFIALVGIIWKI